VPCDHLLPAPSTTGDFGALGPLGFAVFMVVALGGAAGDPSMSAHLRSARLKANRLCPASTHKLTLTNYCHARSIIGFIIGRHIEQPNVLMVEPRSPSPA